MAGLFPRAAPVETPAGEGAEDMFRDLHVSRVAGWPQRDAGPTQAPHQTVPAQNQDQEAPEEPERDPGEIGFGAHHDGLLPCGQG